MKKLFFYFIVILIAHDGIAQDKFLWQPYFSYNNIKDLSASGENVFAASENAIFSRNAFTNGIQTVTTVDGLSGQTITASYYSESFKKRAIGYDNGLLIILDEKDGSLLKKVDIISKQIPANVKKINHFMEYNGILYLSCDFGIVQFNLSTSQFGDTYFIGNTGAQISVKQTTIYNGFLYAATASGIRRANVVTSDLIDYNNWTIVNTGNWTSIEAFDSELIAINSAGYIYRYNGTNFVRFFQLPQASTDMRANRENLLITTPAAVYIYNKQMVLIRQISNAEVLNDTLYFTCSIILGDMLFIGTRDSGLFSSLLSSVSVFENTTPDGPLKNNIFSLNTGSSSLWAVYGDYGADYNPYPLDSYGISTYNGSGWLNIPYSQVLSAKSITKIVVNPRNENEVFASSFFSGLLKIENNVPTVLYNEKNSGLETLTFVGPSYIDVRINGTAFDKSGNLWVTNSLVKNGLKVLKTNGQWQSYSLEKVVNNTEDTNFANVVIDKNNTKWIATQRDGVIGFNETSNKIKKITVGADAGNLPIADVRSVAIDTKNQLWIGTTRGLRVLQNVSGIQSDNQLKANPIIIMEDNVAQELLYEQFITSIAVDGANNKWIGTADSGVFMVSPNGQKTNYHFTVSNSPLPDNGINDVKINNVTGEVFIATKKGMISFKGTATQANENLSNVYVYPNPVRPGYAGTVKIAGLLDKANIKITDIEGNLVYETISEGGTIEWDTTAFGKYQVASGVYMIFISAQDGGETKVKKVMIIR
jgi:hypothetical protein